MLLVSGQEKLTRTLKRREKGIIAVVSVNKFAVLLLIAVLTLSSLTMVGSAFAESVPKPSVPEFTAKAVANTLEVTIKNQPLTPYENGSYPSLYYMFRFKDHDDEMIGFWDYDPVYFVLPSTYGGYYKASDSDFTVVSLSVQGRHFPSGQIDIQAIALVGNQYPTNMQNGTVYGFEGVVGTWSNIQTFTFEENADSPQFPSWIILPLLLIAALVVIVYRNRLKKKSAN